MLHIARSVGLAIVTAALAASATGCAPSQLRVIVPDPDDRPGTLNVVAQTSLTDEGRMLSHVFDGPSQTPANVVFTFDPKPRWSYMVAVVTSFSPTQPRADECILTCTHYLELRPGHQHRIETQIPILPHACSYYYAPGASEQEVASALCAAAASLVQIPNCQFVAHGNSCTLVCPDTAPEDPTPNAPSDQNAQAHNDNGPPITPPATPSSSDAGFDSGVTDAGSDVGSMTHDDVPTVTPPSICGGVDINCDGVIDTWPCGTGYVCDNDQCVLPCVEGSCLPNQTCTAAGLCVDTACLTVTCGAGQRCRNGLCTDACDGVTCSGGQVCRAGLCLSPCPDR